MEGLRYKKFRDFKDSCRRLGGKIEETDIEIACSVGNLTGKFILHMPKGSLYGNFKFETRDGRKIGVIFDQQTIDII